MAGLRGAPVQMGAFFSTVSAAATLFLSSMAKPVASASHALNPAAEAGAAAVAGAGAMAEAGAMAPPFLGGFNPLKFMLTILGIPVEHLVEGSRKCVAELGPEAMEAMGAVKALLVMGAPCALPSHPQGNLTARPQEKQDGLGWGRG